MDPITIVRLSSLALALFALYQLYGAIFRHQRVRWILAIGFAVASAVMALGDRMGLWSVLVILPVTLYVAARRGPRR